MPVMSQKAYAERKGCSAQYINKLVSQGKIKKVQGNKIDSAQADVAIKAYRRAGNTNPGKTHSKKSEQKTANTAPAPEGEHEQDEHETEAPKRNSATASLTASRAEREKYQARIAKLEYEKLVGTLVPRDQLLVAERRKNETIRSKFRALPRSLAPMLSRASSPAEVEALLRSEIDVVLEQLSRDPLGMAVQETAVAASSGE